MRTAAGALALLLALGAGAQGAPRLVDAIEAPMLYLTLGAAEEEEGPGAGPSRHAVQRLLADPAFDALLGAGGAAPGRAESSSARALALVRSVLGKSSGEVEIVLTGVVPGVGQPLLVLRARLQEGEVSRLEQALAGEGNGLAAKHRVLGGRQTYAMLGAGGRHAEGAGEQVELAIVGRDLVVANDTMAIEELLAPAAGTSAKRLVLSADPRFVRLRERLDVPVGSLVVYGDWQRLAQRLQGRGDTADEGLPAFMLRWSGLDAARGVMASLSAGENGFTGTVLLDFDQRGDTRPVPPPRRRREVAWGDLGIDGWFASALSIPAPTLLQDLPAGGLGGLVLAVDLRDIAGRSHRGAELLRRLRRSFANFGLDFERNVLSRLGERGTVQLLFRRGGGQALTELGAIYSVRATSRAGAKDLFTDLRRAAEQNDMGRLVAGRPKRSVEILALRIPWQPALSTYVAVHEAAVLVAFDPTIIDDYLLEAKKVRQHRSLRASDVGRAVQRIGGDDVTGLFDLDFTPWFDHLAGLLAGRPTAVDLSGIPRRHIGYLDLQEGEHDTVLRICVLSSR